MVKATICSQYEFDTEEDLHFIAVTIFDAMMFAGGINIGNLLWNSLSVIYSPDIEVISFEHDNFLSCMQHNFDNISIIACKCKNFWLICIELKELRQIGTHFVNLTTLIKI